MSPGGGPAPSGERPRRDGRDGPEEDREDREDRETPYRRTRGTPGLVCELCGGPVLDRHCKIVCLNCGYQRDCSDP